MTSSVATSVIIPALNSADMIGDLLSAITHQIHPPTDYEIIVVDNGSQDGTCDVVRKFAVTLLTASQRGPGAARNCGLQAARGEVIAYVDADTLPTRRWLCEIVKPFDDPSVILVGGRTLSYRARTPAQRYIARVGALHFERKVGRDLFPFVASRNVAVRREAALAIGGWAEDMPTSEDVDFCFRLARHFHTNCLIQPTALVFHRDRPTLNELCRQAWTYGEGWGHMYLKYPEVARWNFGRSIELAQVLADRSIAPAILRFKRVLHRATDDEVEFADCHRLWSWSFWRGFRHMLRYRQRRDFSNGRPHG